MARHLQGRGRRKKRRCFDASGKEIPCPESKKGLSNGGGVDLTLEPDTMIETAFETRAEVIKVDEELGLVFGWAIICTEHGEPYFDLQKDHIPDMSMLRAATDFMKNSRAAKEMHCDSRRGDVVFAFPMTAEVAKAFGIQTDRTGLMVAMAPDEEMLGKFKRKELTGFSIGGKRGTDRILEN